MDRPLGILNDALKYYHRFLLRNSDDAMIQEQTGRANMRVAELYRLLGYQDSAAASYQRAIDLLTELREDAPNGRVFPLHLGYAYAGAGGVLHSTGNLPEAAQAYRKAIEVFEGRPSETGPAAASRIPVFETRIELAHVLADLGEFDEAERYYRSDVEYERKRMAEGPLSLPESRALARGCIGLGNLLYRTGRYPEAAELYRMAADLRQKSADGVPKGQEEMEELAWSLNNLGAAIWTAGDLRDAEDPLQRALEIAETLTARSPTAAAYRSQYAVIKGNLALVKQGSQRDGEAEADNRRAIEVLEALAAESPEVLAYREHLCKFLNNLGTLLIRQSRWAEAEPVLRRAVAEGRLLALVYDDQPETSCDLARSLANLTVLLVSADRQGEAEKVWEEYAKIQSERQARFSASALGGRLPPLDAERRLAAKPIDAAVVSSCPLRWSYWSPRESSAALLDQARDCPTQATMSGELAWMLATRPGGSRDNLLRAAEQARLAVTEGPRKPENWRTLGLVEYRLGNHAAADDSLKKSVILDGRQPLPMFLLALVHCRMGNLGQARAWYDMAEVLQKKDPASLSRLPNVRDEAAAMLRSLGQLQDTDEPLDKTPETTK